MNVQRQSLIGLSLAALIVGGWLALHIWGVFFHSWSVVDWVRAPLIVLLQGWLGAGMFIVAHDAIHGSLAPGRRRLNALVGQICVGLYAGFSFRKLAGAHQKHHDAPGTAADPDFHPERPADFAPWLYRFFLTHFGWIEFARVTAVLVVYLLLGAQVANLIVFWGLPAILSALQLFTFGTYLPHRHEEATFADAHHARSLNYPWLLSLLTCFHFGRHHEHHLHPEAPWWRLPSVKLG
ncbi:fatty acid desaturase [Phenylobacterium deserti]|uniref:Beta-carotene ketolase n=1 Tax=Phenylobacterium deserti TaxID=1914756 RepID=A0A328ACX2_9CAUL|nr:fatty acid desaturase [Phenylobacterium deserti]RAK52501.1 beta-carotene ketolase [Phenylobacterium deserti]